LKANEINSTATSLVWSVRSPSSNGTVVSYFIERHQNNTGTFANLATVGSVNNYTDDTRVSGYPYVYRVTALENGKPVAMSYPAKISPMLFGLFTPHWTPSIVANVSSHLGKNDFGINDFRTLVTDMFPAGIQKDLLYCAVTNATQNSTSCLNFGENQTRINAAGHGISYLMYDSEGSNDVYSSPAVELQNPAYYTEKAANDVHSFGYAFGASPSGIDSSDCFDNPVPSCGLLFKELRKVNWAHVDLLDLQFQSFNAFPKFAPTVQNVTNWVYSNSSGHTLIMAQVSFYNGKPLTAEQILPNLFAIKNMVNGTDIECGYQGCNTTATEIIFRSMMR
jgi:hypothetical protein